MDSATTSPASTSAETWVPGAKLRLMCCYGGHIIPRPHGKALCYAGGDKRIVVVDRGVSLEELHRHLSHSLLNGQRFSLKYQLPNEDLDSLVSIATDEDLENMIQEYDRTMPASPLRPRLRFFLFPDKPESAASAGCLLADAKSEQWFVDAISDSGLVSRGFSDSGIDINMIELDGISISKDDDSCADMESQNGRVIKNSIQDVHVPVPAISSYYPMYAPPQPQPIPLQVDQQSTMYVFPVAQAPAYNLPAAVQSNISDAAAVAPPNVAIIPPICATNTTTLYRTAAAAAAPTPTTVVQVPTTNQFQYQPHVGLSPLPPSQHITAAASPATINYTLDYTHPATGLTLDQVYYAQLPAVAPIPSQYQTVTPTTAVLISQTTAQLPGENSATSQPL